MRARVTSESESPQLLPETFLGLGTQELERHHHHPCNAEHGIYSVSVSVTGWRGQGVKTQSPALQEVTAPSQVQKNTVQ